MHSLQAVQTYQGYFDIAVKDITESKLKILVPVGTYAEV